MYRKAVEMLIERREMIGEKRQLGVESWDCRWIRALSTRVDDVKQKWKTLDFDGYLEN